ncbi:hypothetical protein [Paractinoplanes lichenicola]|uniref:GNAT family N-acetyltransferase n=1 Tax=Paractinoplanes lichenicola TaxID=2802976 RepID=A0ABS1VW81_9ACTN|nr:hypothetical protein [Actinoplanes lichenicola]MBL7258742.1 hypothetical protein [Actinoplanes lichenicola]
MTVALLNAAVRNNADWVSAVCRAHGIGYTFAPRAWRSSGPTPQFYPEAITLRPTATADDVLPAASVKDSFATLDLAPHGFTELFAAEWICRPASASPPTGVHVTAAADPRSFPAALLDDPAVRVLAVHEGDRLRGGFVLNRTGGVLGLSNVFATDPGDLPLIWSAATATGGGLPMVGYESGDDLVLAHQAGFRSIGPLRIWASTA